MIRSQLLLNRVSFRYFSFGIDKTLTISETAKQNAAFEQQLENDSEVLWLPPPEKHKPTVLGIFRSLLHASTKMPQYHQREYLFSQIKSEFRSNKSLDDPKELETCIRVGKGQIDTIEQYALTLSQLFEQGPEAVESFYSSHPLMQDSNNISS